MRKYAEIASPMMSHAYPLFITLPECLLYQKWCPYKGRGVVSAPICFNKVRMVQTLPTFLQQPPCAQHVVPTPTHLPLSHLPLSHFPLSHLPLSHLAQKLSSKQIVPTDSIWPKPDNAKRHQWFKEFNDNTSRANNSTSNLAMQTKLMK